MLKYVLSLLLMPALLASSDARASAQPNGQHDFDFEIGAWKIAVKRLVHPLTGSTEWVSPTGRVHIVRKLWDGASLAQLEDEHPKPHFLGLMLRMYNPASHQWNVYWGASADGTLDPPLVGSFINGRGEFYCQTTLGGRTIFARVVYSRITATSFHTEQAFSDDGGKTWQTNLIQDFTREK